MITVGTEAALRATGLLRIFHGKAIEAGIKDAAQLVLEESRRLVPKDTRELERSSKIVVTGSSWRTQATVGYYTHYAWPVHEIPDAEHTPPTQYKYLTTAVRNVKGRMNTVIQTRLKAATRGLEKK